jgi:type II secretory pathway pseudopilin PulG
MNKKVYGAFTLVEMLVVMGILIILMVVGISAGSFALNRASDVAHRNAADQLYEGLQAYYVDHRSYPGASECKTVDEDGNILTQDLPCSPEALMKDPDMLGKYMDLGAFSGGSGATFLYFVGGPNGDQAVLVCVTMRGDWKTNVGREDSAVYCAGNGFGQSNMSDGATSIGPLESPLIEETNPDQTDEWAFFSAETNPYLTTSYWDGQAWAAEPS